MVEGLRYAASDPRTRLLVFLGAAPYFLLVPVWGTLLPIYAKDVFAAGPKAWGCSSPAWASAARWAASPPTRSRHAERQGLIQAAWIVLMAVAILGLAASPTLPLAFACGLVLAAPRRWRIPRATWRCCR